MLGQEKIPSWLLRGLRLADGVVLACVFGFCPIILAYICALLTCELDPCALCYVLTSYFRRGLVS